MKKSRTELISQYKPLAYLRLAASYNEAALVLCRELGSEGFRAPQRFLFEHAVELYLKSYLLVKGFDEGELKNNSGHDIKKLMHECNAKGLDFTDKDIAVIGILRGNSERSICLYPVTGHYQTIELSDILETCKSLLEKIAPLLGPSGQIVLRKFKGDK